MSTIAERVARGAALLDEREPGWHQRIDLETLDMELPCNCVLGQLHHDQDDPLAGDGYWPALEELGIPAWPVSKPAAYAFAADKIGGYPALTAAWRELIESRRAAS